MIPFPRQSEVGSDEDGMGYALRMAVANGLTFNELACHFATPGHLSLPSSSVACLAFMFGCRPERLREAFVLRHFRAGTQAAHFLGHTFLKPYHLRQARPQLCPKCLDEGGFARAVWSISLLTACVKHGVRLVDRCVCSRLIRWRRPSLDFCECGWRLADVHKDAVDADARELSVSSQIEYLVGPAHVSLSFSDPPPFLDGFDTISIDTLVRLLWILGIVDDSQIKEHPPSANRGLSTAEASLIVCRAYDRLSAIVTTSSSSRPVRVASTALRALVEDASSAAESTLLSALCRRLQRTAPSMTAQKLLATNRQLTLFGDDHD